LIWRDVFKSICFEVIIWSYIFIYFALYIPFELYISFGVRDTTLKHKAYVNFSKNCATLNALIYLSTSLIELFFTFGLKLTKAFEQIITYSEINHNKHRGYSSLLESAFKSTKILTSWKWKISIHLKLRKIPT